MSSSLWGGTLDIRIMAWDRAITEECLSQRARRPLAGSAKRHRLRPSRHAGFNFARDGAPTSICGKVYCVGTQLSMVHRSEEGPHTVPLLHPEHSFGITLLKWFEQRVICWRGWYRWRRREHRAANQK